MGRPRRLFLTCCGIFRDGDIARVTGDQALLTRWATAAINLVLWIIQRVDRPILLNPGLQHARPPVGGTHQHLAKMQQRILGLDVGIMPGEAAREVWMDDQQLA